MLRIEGLRKEFVLGGGRRVVALDSVNLEVRHGECAVVVGANGAGKSTLFDLIAGRAPVDKGRIFIGGVEVTATLAHKRARSVTLVNQARGAGLPRAMTVREVMQLTLENSGSCNGADVEATCNACLDRLEPGLSRVLGSQLWYLSGGEYQLVALGVATILCADSRLPHLLLLDEHISQLSPTARDRVLRATAALVEQKGLTTMLATHSPVVATSLGSRQLVLGGGRIHTDLAGDRRISDPDKLRRLLIAIAGTPCERTSSVGGKSAVEM